MGLFARSAIDEHAMIIFLVIVLSLKTGSFSPQKKGGFFSGLGAKFEKVGKDVSKAADSAATSVSQTVDEKWKSHLLVRPPPPPHPHPPTSHPVLYNYADCLALGFQEARDLNIILYSSYFSTCAFCLW